jgi:hypothetical protein
MKEQRTPFQNIGQQSNMSTNSSKNPIYLKKLNDSSHQQSLSKLGISQGGHQETSKLILVENNLQDKQANVNKLEDFISKMNFELAQKVDRSSYLKDLYN